ncbi:hypothetical protein LWI28_019100 [Acer negundo]|uniref:Uncharacterized protein n=1 Tax=Acer negundo TaxID=4023 RepID=A0AAD5ISI8_ACENE|nr:hypothetical protein LWI28_001769 [Acer negundo]KAI9176449.1 hypothetical protein LWI28_002971 [Acer negundo]KAI9176772.1 hypothetical protein LWI28_007010 [Acer negundo]KAI9177772.1 hypothetical protein LWI28_019100 [Acer negundo]
MGKLYTAAVFLMLMFVTISEALVVDISKHGARQNADIAQALTLAFKEACASTTESKVLIPKGTYKLSAVKLEGPCKAPIEIQVQATLIALTEKTTEPSWVLFNHIDHLTVSGGGVFDGQGSTAWGKCGRTDYCRSLPINLSFNDIKGGLVQGVTSKDSKQFHANVIGCTDLHFVRFTTSAPHDSLHTDGIHIGRSTGIKVLDSNIKTGDDCISIGDGNQQITIERVTCGPGHGFSVGSLGRYQNEAPVIGVTVRNCTMTDSMNGVRVKTWPASYQGAASDMHFEDIIMNNVGNPILIDQVYCPWNDCNTKIPSKVKVSKVTFKNIRGTSSTPVAVKLSCSPGNPCQGVELSNIDLTYTGKEAPAAISECSHVQPKVSGTMNPKACTAPVTAY